ncbi:MAG: hypothetical protein WD009_14575 [Phycisphaeraceae bacterium]
MTAAISRWIDDRLNPVVVKELRQAVRSRFVMVLLMVYLLVQLVMMGIYLLATDHTQASFYAGRTMFMFLEGVLLATCLLFVPGYVGFRLAAERSDINVDLVFITTIRPTSIIWGKFVSGLTLTVLLYSASAPFMVLTYLLRGIDIPSIALVLGLNLLVIFAATQFALLIGAMNATRVLKGILGIVMLGLLMATHGAVMGTSSGMIFFGVGGTLGTWDFWGPALGVLALGLGATGLFFFIAVAAIAPPSSNRALPVRVYTTGLWLVTLALAMTLSLNVTGEAMSMWLVTAGFVLALLMVGAGSERDALGIRIRRLAPRRAVVRLPVFLWCSGAAAGLLWCGLLLALTVAVGLLWEVFAPPTALMHGLDEVTWAVAALGLYSLAYVLTAVTFRRLLLPRTVKTSVVAALTLMLAALGTVIPPLIAFFFDPMRWYDTTQGWMLLNPMGAFVDPDDTAYRNMALLVSGLWVVAMVLLNLRWLLGQWWQFRSDEASLEEAKMEDDVAGT